METKIIFDTLVDVHNKLLDISVKGEDVIRMADILKGIRMTVVKIQQSNLETIGGDTNDRN